MNSNQNGEKSFKTEDYFFVAISIIEALIIGLFIALNYIFRFDSTVRYNSDMIDFNQVFLPCDPFVLNYELSRPYFDYDVSSTKSLDGLELSYDLPEWVFFLCIFLTPIAIFCFGEIFKLIISNKRFVDKEIFGVFIPHSLTRIVKISAGYLLGGSLAGLFTTVWKLNVASPRPHFMSVCLNNQSDGLDYDFCRDQKYWKPSLDCFNEDVEESVEALKSFPSYHATLAVYSAAYTSAYIVLGVKVRKIFTGSTLLVFGIIIMGLIGATHRMSSGYSFPRDIFWGALIGLIAAYYMKISTSGIIIMGLIGATHRMSSGYSFPRDIFWGALIGLIAAYYMVVYHLHNFRIHKNKLKLHSKIRSSSAKGNDNKKVSEEDSDNDSDFDSDGSSSDYDQFLHKIGSYPILPRVQQSDMPLQAVNPAMQVPRNPPLPMPKKGGIPSRSHSSVGRTYAETQIPNQSYNVPRQRQSAPPAKDGSLNGHTNYGYSGNPRDERPGVLSAYSPPNDRESFSRF